MSGARFPRTHASSHYGNGVDPIPGIPPFSPYSPTVVDISDMGAGAVLELQDQIVVLVGAVPEGFRVELDNAAVINSSLQIGSDNYGDPLFTLLGNSLVMDTYLIGSPTDIPVRRLFALEGERNRLVRVIARVSFDEASAWLEAAAGSLDNHVIDCEAGRDDVGMGGFVLMNGELLVHGSLLRSAGPTSMFSLLGGGGMAAMNFNQVGLEPDDPNYLGIIDLGSSFGTIRNAGNIMSRVQAAGAIFDPAGLPLSRPALEQHSPGAGTTEAQQTMAAPGDAVELGTDAVMVDTSAGAVAFPLPTPAAGTRRISIQDVTGDAAVNNITVSTPSGAINGAPTATINVAYGSLTLRSDGTNWNFN